MDKFLRFIKGKNVILQKYCIICANDDVEIIEYFKTIDEAKEYARQTNIPQFNRFRIVKGKEIIEGILHPDSSNILWVKENN